MDQNNIYLISPTSYEKKKMNNPPKDSNFESYDIINLPQNQAEIKKEGPSVTQLSNSGHKKTSFKPKTQQIQEINFLPSSQSQNDEIIQEQERFEQARLRLEPFIVAKSRFQRNGFAHLEQWSSEKGTEMEIEESEEGKVPSENYEDEDNDDDSYTDLFDNLRDKNEGSFTQAEEEKVDLEESQVFEGSNGSTGEPLMIQAIEEINEEKADLNGNEVFESWSDVNEDQPPQYLKERIEKFDLTTSEFFKDSNGNNEYSISQDREDCMNVEFNLNTNGSFQFYESFYEANFGRSQESVHQGYETHPDEQRFAIV